MYYITNQNNQIIAIDPSLSIFLEVKNIDELYRNIALGDINFSAVEDGKVTISTAQKEKSFDVENTDLSSMLGNMTLVQVQISREEPMVTDDETAPIEELLDIETAEKKEDELFDLLLPDTLEEAIDKEAIDKETIDKETIDEEIITEDKEEKQADDNKAPIVIDIEKISQNIGISTEDYNTFLNEYIDTALSLEADLQSTQEEKRAYAIDTLSHLSNVLHLPIINQIVAQIKNAAADNQNRYIESFYTALARLTTTQPDTQEEEALFAQETVSAPVTTESFGTISLDDVQAKHFDFQLEQAANDLNLPVELIKEFVIDFIAQAHTETKKMLEAYEKGDLDTIQKIGHLLKGASSNLRIEPLADTLYKIQFCEDSSKLESLIKQYWALFLSLEIQMNLTTK